MASGNFISATGVNLNVYVVWSSTINVEGNYSTVYMDIYLRHYSLSCGAKSGSATADGSPQSFSTPAYSFGNSLVDTLMASKSFTVYHNSDGTKSCGLSAYWGFVGTYGGQSINGITAAATVTLDTIPRKSSISSLTPTVEVNGSNAVTVAISRASASFTHKVTFSIGAYSQEYTGVATSQAFTIPLAWLNSIPNSVSGVANVRVETFSGATSLGYVDGAFTITAPSTIIPTVTDIAFARDTTGTDPFTTYAKGISKVSVSGVSVTNQYSATTALIKTYLHLASVSYLTGLLYNGSSFISAVIPSSGTMRLTTVVTDSRGRESVAYYEDFTVYDYFTPALTVTAFRCNSAGVADPSGEYLSATMVVNVAPVNNNNTKTYILEYKKTTDSTWTPISTAALTGYFGTLNAVRAASSANTWEVRATITDKVGTTPKATAVGTKRVPINSGFSGTAVAIGKVAETADLLEVDLAAKFNKAVTITGVLTAPVATPTVNGLMPAAFAGGQIAFPATQNPSTDPNTLDDYEEGTYTPTVTAQTGTLTSYTAAAQYIKIGKFVMVSFKINITNKGTGADRLYVSLPFTPNTNGSFFVTEIALTGYGGEGAIFSGNNSVTIYRLIGTTLISTNASIQGTLTYMVA